MRRIVMGLIFYANVCAMAYGHDIYIGVYDKHGQLCCGGTDCAATSWRERKGRYEFFTREQTWVDIPEDWITFLPIPGEPNDAPSDFGHLCYRPATPTDRLGPSSAHVFGDIFVFCAFIKPGGT